MRLAWIVLLTALGGGAQDKDGLRGGIDLRWDLPHDRAAIYDVFDPKTKKKRGEFWLLGCEAQGKLRIGASDTSDLGYRFLFRLPGKKVRQGDSWLVREPAFADPDLKGAVGAESAPRWIVGSYRLRKAGRLRPKDFLKCAGNDGAVEAALIEGRFQVYGARWRKDALVMAERKPSAALETLALVGKSDGTILGGRYVWRGNMAAWRPALFTDPKVGKGVYAAEVFLRSGLLELNIAGLKARIDAAVERGRGWLKCQGWREGKIHDRVGGGHPIGTTAISLLALLHSGVPAKDPVIRAGFQFLSRFEKSLTISYDIALVLMAIEAKYLPIEMLEEARNFSEEKARKDIAEKIGRRDRELAEALAKKLMERQGRSGGFGYTGVDDTHVNLSTTQYAALGLKSAARMGVKVPPAVWKRALRYLEGVMESTGREIELRVEGRGVNRKGRSEIAGWKYSGTSVEAEVSGGMTTAALSTIACSWSELARLGELDDAFGKRLERRTWGGLAWLQEKYCVRAAPPEGTTVWGPAWVYYYLYGLERAGILLGVEKLGGHDWYLEGAVALLSWQREDGRWEGTGGPPILDTAMALLFLKRATIPVETGKPRK